MTSPRMMPGLMSKSQSTQRETTAKEQEKTFSKAIKADFQASGVESNHFSHVGPMLCIGIWNVGVKWQCQL